MQNSDYVLAIDNGTQSVRAMVFDNIGQLVAKSKVDIEPYFSTQPGYAEQQPDYFWSALCQACQELWPQLEIFTPFRLPPRGPQLWLWINMACLCALPLAG
jgi:sugar (pentulose or hexulose) kinase